MGLLDKIKKFGDGHRREKQNQAAGPEKNNEIEEEMRLSESQEILLKEAIAKDRERIKSLSIEARFSYGGILTCYCPVSSLADFEWSKSFCLRMFEHLELSEGHRIALSVFLNGENERDGKAFEENLLREELVDASWIIWQDLLEMSVVNGVYDARARVVALRVAQLFRISWNLVEEYEYGMAENLIKSGEETEEERLEREKKEKVRKRKKWLKVTAAAVGGGALIGITGGLAAPLLAAGAGTVLGASSGAFLASAGGVFLVTTLFGAAGAGLGGYKMKKRVGDLEEFEIGAVVDNKRLHATILVSGWIEDVNEDFAEPWRHLRLSGDIFSVRWDPKVLIDVSTGLKDLIKSGAIGIVTETALKQTLLQGVMMALAWPLALLSASAIIDNPWSIAGNRAKDAGLALANVLKTHVHGHRPVILMGYCFGARAIFYCLLELEKVESLGIVQDVYLFGAPLPVKNEMWKKALSVVSGRMVNGYCKTDWLLRFVYRATAAESKVAGLMPLGMEGIMDLDLSDVVEKSSDYHDKLSYCIEKVGLLSDDVTLKTLSVKASNKSATEDKGEEAQLIEVENTSSNTVVVKPSRSPNVT